MLRMAHQRAMDGCFGSGEETWDTMQKVWAVQKLRRWVAIYDPTINYTPRLAECRRIHHRGQDGWDRFNGHGASAARRRK